jgi:ABC-type antimicrobial peptide transport system permease subunit
MATAIGQMPIRGMVAGPRYIQALGIRVQGRDFSNADSHRDAAILTRRVEEKVFPGQSALGRSIELFHSPYEVIGVVPNAAYSGLREQGGDQFVFVSRSPGEGPGVRYFNIRYTGPLAPVAVAAREVVRDASTTQRIVGSVQTMDTFMQQYTAPALVVSSLLSVFSAGSLLVAGIGLYAVITFHTARRTREFGIRMALGASSRHVLRTVLKEGLALASIGSAVGLTLSAAASRLLSGLLFGVTPLDLLTWIGVIALLAVVSLAACYAPARRAGRIEPLEALRQD